jgi:hypothetical protein
MSDTSENFVVVTITRHEAKVWNTGISPGSLPTKILGPTTHNGNDSKSDPKVSGRGDSHNVPEYFEEVVEFLATASEILLVGHGKGKASAMLQFTQFLERKHPDLAKKVVDAVDTHLESITEPEILALAREWFNSHERLLA